jgi:basic membrane lipoprotein Med (substrate-binding protein (PBP1-ABC) superfamily)
MVIRKLLITGASLVVGVAGGLLGQQANAAEEIVVYGSPSSIGAGAEQAWLEANLAQHSESVTQNLKALLDRNLKTVHGEKPAVELALNEQRTKG